MTDGIEYAVTHLAPTRATAPTEQVAQSTWALLPIPWLRSTFPAWSARHGNPWTRNVMLFHPGPDEIDRLAALRRKAY